MLVTHEAVYIDFPCLTLKLSNQILPLVNFAIHLWLFLDSCMSNVSLLHPMECLLILTEGSLRRIWGEGGERDVEAGCKC
jgi:hypothetical protein